VLFGEYGADQAGDRVAVGGPHDVGPPADHYAVAMHDPEGNEFDIN
jgi:hypothetical protein